MMVACLVSFAALEMRACGSGLLVRAATGATKAGRVAMVAEDGAGRELVGRTVRVAPELVAAASEALAFDRMRTEDVEDRVCAVAASMDFRVRTVDIPGLVSPVSIFEVGDPTGIDGCDVDSERSHLCGGVLWPGARTAAHALASRGPLAGKRVVEVGAGTGLVSMTAAMLGAADVLRHVERAVLAVSPRLANPGRLVSKASGLGCSLHTAEARPPRRRHCGIWCCRPPVTMSAHLA